MSVDLKHLMIQIENQSYLVAGVTGLEPATSCVTGRRSNQLSYTPKMVGAEGLEPTTLSV